MFSMAGGTVRHGLISLNLGGIVRQQLTGSNCIALPSDVRVCVSPGGLYTYPDLSVVCGEPELLDAAGDTLLDPMVIAEVLSPSTEAYDRGRKFEQYRAISSLRHYLLVSQDRMQADLFTRDGEKWILTSASLPHEKLELSAIGCRIQLSDLYDKVSFTEQR